MSTDLSADELVAEFVLEKFRADGHHEHLVSCPDIEVTYVDGKDGVYWCDTGCEYVRLNATLSCPHGYRSDYEYGTFGDLSDLLLDIERSR